MGNADYKPPAQSVQVSPSQSLATGLAESASDALTWLMRNAVDKFLASSIRHGSVTFRCSDTRYPAEPHEYGEPRVHAEAAGRPVATLTILNVPSFYARVATAADIGFAEAFIASDVVVDNEDELVNFFRVLILNRDQEDMSSSNLVMSKIGAVANRVLHVLNANSISGSQRNIEAHYDLSNELFATFLGPTWTYSCGYFEGPSSTLDDAQIAKLDMMIRKANLTKDCHLLEIGCGWGELAIRAAKSAGCRVTGITLSREQLDLATVRAKKAGVDHLVSFEMLDYRALPEKRVRYDRIISIEMLEAVGHEFLGSFFKVLDAVLADDGVAVIQVITTPEKRYDAYRSSVDFIQKHIFPGGICPSLQAVTDAMVAHSNLILENVENIGTHYATTLREWRRLFLSAVTDGSVQAAGFDKWFIRKWIYYFCYCESGFATRTLGDLQLVLSRPGNCSTLGGPPLAAH